MSFESGRSIEGDRYSYSTVKSKINKIPSDFLDVINSQLNRDGNFDLMDEVDKYFEVADGEDVKRFVDSIMAEVGSVALSNSSGQGGNLQLSEMKESAKNISRVISEAVEMV